MWLRDTYNRTKKASKDGKVNTVVIIRASKEVEYQHVFRMLNLAKAEGFRTFKLKAMTKTPGQK